MRGALPTNILEECYIDGVKQLCPICVKNEPDQNYVTINLTTTTKCLPPIFGQVQYKDELQDESYDEVETDLGGYLSDKKPVPIERDSSDAKEFEDQPRITSHPPGNKRNTIHVTKVIPQLPAGGRSL